MMLSGLTADGSPAESQTSRERALVTRRYHQSGEMCSRVYNHALSQDLPRTFLRRPHWRAAGAFLVQAAESGSDKGIQRATDELLRAIELEGWMNRVPAAAPSIAGQHLAAEATEVITECSAPSG